jgi:hypothetical protein
MKVARSTNSCMFGARYGVAADSTLAEVDAELRRVEQLLLKTID